MCTRHPPFGAPETPCKIRPALFPFPGTVSHLTAPDLCLECTCPIESSKKIQKALDILVGFDTLLNLRDNLSGFFSRLGLKIIPLFLCSCCLVHDDLLMVSLGMRNGRKYRTYLESCRMPPQDFASNYIAKMDCGSLPLSFKHRLPARSWHNV
jgi:hypothetical protein